MGGGNDSSNRKSDSINLINGETSLQSAVKRDSQNNGQVQSQGPPKRPTRTEATANSHFGEVATLLFPSKTRDEHASEALHNGPQAEDNIANGVDEVSPSKKTFKKSTFFSAAQKTQVKGP